MAVNLPEVATGALPADDVPPVVVSLDARGGFFVDEEAVELDGLAAVVAAARGERSETVVLVRADQAVPYGQVMALMAELRAAGIDRVGLVTDPPAGAPAGRSSS